MEKSYDYFKNLLDQCTDSVNQHKIKTTLIKDLQDTISSKIVNVQEQINKLQKAFMLNSDNNVIANSNQIQQLQNLLGEKDEIIKSLQSRISILTNEISMNNSYTEPIDDLPF